MPSSESIYDLPSGATSRVVKEEHIEYGFIGKLQNLNKDVQRLKTQMDQYTDLTGDHKATIKTDAFRHEHLGQLNTYVAYYKRHQMTPGRPGAYRHPALHPQE